MKISVDKTFLIQYKITALTQHRGHDMYRLIILFLVFSFISFANEPVNLAYIQSLSDFDGEPSSFVDGCVNAISGNFTETISSFSMPGIHPLEFSQTYTSDWSINGSGGIREVGDFGFSYHYTEMESDELTGHFSDEYGSGIGLKSKGGIEIKCNYDTVKSGVTNSSSGIISGRTNVTNIGVYQNGNNFKITTGTGNVYECKHKPLTGETGFQKAIKRPSGLNTTINYEVDNKKNIVKTFRKNLDRKGEVLSELSSTYNKETRHDYIITNDNHVFEYIVTDIDKRNYTLDIITNYAPSVHYHFSKWSREYGFKLTRKELPDQRVKEISYYHKGKNPWGNTVIDTKNHYPRSRVCQIKEPVGTDATLIPTYRFKYEVEGHHTGLYCRTYGNCDSTTTVFDALDHKTIYEINCDQRLESILKYKGKGDKATLYSKETLNWAGMMLNGRALLDQSNVVHLQRKFTYDPNGNIIKNCIQGDFTGESRIIKKGELSEFEEAFCTSYSYTQRYNLMASEDDGRRKIRYIYHEGTDYLRAKLVVVNNRIIQRTFYEYDWGGAVIYEVNDDGSSENVKDLTNVTERHITRTENTKKLPAGLPRIVQEFYYDKETGTEVLLRKVISSYDKQGHLLKEDHYDSNGTFAYTLTWEYDQFGNVISETNALGLSTIYRYDANNNKIYEQGPNLLYHFEYGYDFVNRLIREEKITCDGQRFVTHHKYDYLGNRISTVDHLGNETKFKFDDFNRLVKTTFPKVLDSDENEINYFETVKPTFLGFPGIYVNVDGEVTKRTFNVRGKPTQTIYPNGSKEVRRYNIYGDLIKVIAPNQTKTIHEYDALGRLTKTEIYDGRNVLLSRSTNVYNNLHLIEEHDAEGYVTYYQYDGAGRISRKTCGNTTTTFHYDSLGRMNEERRWTDEQHYIAFIKVYDVLQKVIEERIEDEAGVVYTKLGFTYDEEGRLLEKLCWNENGLSIESQCYDAFGNIVEHVDQEGNKTITIYHYDHVNALGQFVASSETINPLGIKTVTTHDAMGRIAHQKTSNSLGDIIQEKNLFYDGAGHLVRQVNKVFGRESPPITTLFSYDCMGHLISITEAADTVEERTMSHKYNSFGQKSQDIKPDGVIVKYKYDALGRVKTAQSSDNTINYSYKYNALNNLISVTDRLSGLTTTKTYDAQGNIVDEILANGKQLSYQYDGLGRELWVTLPDQSRIGYTYDARMRSVERYDPSGYILYRHTYDQFDNSGNLLKESFLKNSGQRLFHWNLKNQMVSMTTNVWNETGLEYDGLGNLTFKVVQGVPTNYQYDGLEQLTQEQGRFTHDYRYDSLYNRIEKDGTSYDINSLNQLTKAGNAKYSYDRSGRLTKIEDEGQITEFTYDAFDRLTRVNQNDVSTIYVYDAENRRILKKKDNGEDLHYIYQGQREIGCCSIDGTIHELRLLGLTKGAELGASVALEIEGNVYAPIHDHHGNLTALIDPLTGQLVETYDYSAFGERGDGEKISPWQFSSKRFDEETGFYYYGRRYYDPKTARWITQDPLGFEGGPNLYAFVLNNPLKNYDFYGLETSAGFEDIEPENPDKPKGIIGRIRETIGDVICYLADHCLPIPYVRQGISYVGHRIAGRSHEYAMKHIEITRSHNREFRGLGTAVRLDKVSVLAINGINTLFSDTFFGMLSTTHGSTIVDATYNASHGVTIDLFECILNHLGVPTNVERMLVKNIRSSIARMGGVGGGGIIYLHGHSQGGLILYSGLMRLTPEERAMIDVTTYGSAKMISGMGLAGSRNYINSDLVPYISDPIGVLKGLLSKDSNVHFIKREGSFPGCAHAVRDNYYGVMEENGRIFKDKYGLK